MKRMAVCVLAVALFVAIGPVRTEAATAPVIQPGVRIAMGDSLCTLNWIYDGTGGQASGKVFAGTAKHCVSGPGQRISLSNGVDLPFGTVRYTSPKLDYALIEIDSGLLSHVDAAMKGHPDMPTGVSTTSTAGVGDIVQFSGYGVGFDLLALTQESRQGVLGYNDGEQHYAYGLVTPGDSGGPVADVTDGGKALGIVDTVGAALTPVPQVGEGGVSVQGLLADAADHGFPVRLRTV